MTLLTTSRRSVAWILLGPLSLACFAAGACSGDDGAASVEDAAVAVADSNAATDAKEAAPATDAAAPDSALDAADAALGESVCIGGDAGLPSAHGLFFTEERYRANFAAAYAPADRRAYADQLCQQSAVAVGLRGVYRSVLATTSAYEIVPALGEGSWCAVRDGAPHCVGDDVIFASAPSLEDPDHGLFSDQFGNATNPSGVFFAGVAPGSDDGPTTVNCEAWSSLDPVARPAVGQLDGASKGPWGSWYSANVADRGTCATAEQPLLCIETAPCVQ